MAGSKNAIGSDLARIDAHVIQPAEYEDIPELTDAWFEQATIHDNTRPRGRPPALTTKRSVTIRLDADLVDAFRSSGPGWQTRINDMLRRAMAFEIEGSPPAR